MKNLYGDIKGEPWGLLVAVGILVLACGLFIKWFM